MNIVDLHVHSTSSDGSFTPSELVDYAVQKGLSAFALTDHDTISGIEEATMAARDLPVEVIPGIEFSTEYEGKDIHIVGLFIDYKSEVFQKRLVRFMNGRIARNQEMCRRLQAHGISIDYDALSAEFQGSAITRAHFARYLLSHGYVKSLKEAFDRYIGDHAPCFVPRRKITPARAIELILKAGGLPILAHPILYHFSHSKLDTLVSRLKHVGLVGIEAIYSTYTPSEEREIRELAKKYDLCISGGSDFHGAAKPSLDLATGYGKLFIPEEILTTLKEKQQEIHLHPELYQMKKILFTDLDNTLLDSQKQISAYTREVLDAFTKAGNRFVLCSGRDINSVLDVKRYLQLDYPGMYACGYNGGQIVDCESGKTLYKITIPYEKIRYLQAAAAKEGLHFHTYSDTNILSPTDDEQLHFYQQVIKTPLKLSQELLEVKETGACKCLVIELHDLEKLEAFRKSMIPWSEENGISMMYSNPYYLEIIPSNSGKGSAVLKLCEILQIDPALSIAAGDEGNDVSMIEMAGYGIGMCNGTDEVKDAATRVTDYDMDHDGLAKVLIDLF